MTSDYLIKVKEEVFSDMKVLMSGTDEVIEEVEVDTDVENVVENSADSSLSQTYEEVINWDKYYGILEIPRIGLKRGFYNLDSKYNSIDYNVTMVEGSSMPNVERGNLILMAHSGDSYISYFAYLYRLSVGDYAYVTYQGTKYKYQIVNIYDVEKNGNVEIIRSYNKTTLTLVTCTKDNDSSQTVYIAELV